MFSITQQQILLLVASFIWPFCRVIGLMSVAPIFGHNSVPATVKIGLSVAIAMIVSPVIPTPPAIDPFSLNGFALVVQQSMVGAMLGFSTRLIFSSVEYAGELMGFTMGFGFAMFFDPRTQGQSSAISQFLSLLLFMLFLSLDMHLVLLGALVESFQTLPIGHSPFGSKGLIDLVYWAGTIFSIGLQISMPVIAAMLISNIALGILTRAAPQLNLFGIGFPILLFTGFSMIVLVLPYLKPVFIRVLENGMKFSTGVPASLLS